MDTNMFLPHLHFSEEGKANVSSPFTKEEIITKEELVCHCSHTRFLFHINISPSTRSFYSNKK